MFFVHASCLLILHSSVYGFNFDAKNVQRIPFSGGYFGFSLLLQANAQDSNVFVGAPKANSSIHPGIEKPGAVYRCRLTDGSCQEYVVDVEGNIDGQWTDGQLFGSSMDGSSVLGETIVICAPRRQWTNKQIAIPIPNGACFVVSNSTDPGKYNKLDPFEYTENGEAGISIRYAEDGSHLLLGALGNGIFAGTITYKDKPYDDDNCQILNEKFFTKSIYSNTGYAVHSGRFLKSSAKYYWYVAGAPADNDLLGATTIYENERPQIKQKLLGEQRGSCFGASVLSVDTNNDSADDLLVGAPTYRTNSYDEGCVYFYKNDGYGSFEPPVKMFGVTAGGRFGTTLAAIGDINRDLFKDVAIAAPYEGTGVVYIYLGSKERLKSEWSQKIEPEHFNIPNPRAVKGFGFSVSKGVDVDHNGHNDRAIGAYITGEVFVVKSSPIVTYYASLQPNVTELSVNDQKQFTVRFCLWTGSTSKEATEILTIYNILVDSRGTTNFTSPKVGNVTKSHTCETVAVTLTKNVYNNTNPLIITLTYKPQLQTLTDFCRNCPIVEPFAANQSQIQIPFVHGCGADEICDTDLKVAAQFEDLSTLTLGTQSNVKLKITVENRGEPAYICKLSVTLPPDVNLVQLPSTCVLSDRVLSCLVENNLVQNVTKTLLLNLDVEKVTMKVSAITITLNVTSAGREVHPEDNTAVVILPVELDVKPQITWLSVPEHTQYTYNTGKLIKQLSFEHQFSLSNSGASPMNVDVNVVVPVIIDDEEVFSIFPKATVNNRPSTFCALETKNGTFSSETRTTENAAQNFVIPTLTDENVFKNATPGDRTLHVSCRDPRVKRAKIKCSGFQCNFFRREYKEKLINESDESPETTENISEPNRKHDDPVTMQQVSQAEEYI